MRLILATQNIDKISEIKALISNLPVEILTQDQLSDFPNTIEDKNSLKGNAEKKAKNVWKKFKLPVVADDTGLFVDYLNGQPGVKSSRYAGENATYKQNREKLLKELHGVSPIERGAKFRTVLVFIDEDGVTHYFMGVCKGFISEKESGDKGFGYDSLFHPLQSNKSFSQLTSQEKNEISHRGIAMRKFRDFLKKNIS